MKFHFGDWNVFLPIAETKFGGSVAGLADDEAH